VTIGQVLLGKYRVDSILGHGGMGIVAKCTHLIMGGAVAIKMLRRDVLNDRDAVERFTREAKAAHQLRSEHVARVLDVGNFEDGVPYMVMEFLDGQNLGELLEQTGCLAAPLATQMMLQTAEALAEAHSIGIVHRDVKPTNLFYTWRPDGSALIKVLDFGISKSPMGTDLQLTQTQSLLGTPAYMSPEQMRSARLVDARTDIWSLGTVIYELIEGRRPFEAESFSEMCVKVACDLPAPFTNMPPDLQPVVLRCLSKQPDQRYATMAELGRDLVPFAQDPSQATMLVERMMRLLRRSSGADWDTITNGGRASAVDHRLDHRLAPAAPRIATPPVGIPQQPRAPSPHALELRSPGGQHEVNTLRDRPPRRSRARYFIFAAMIVAGIGFGMYLARGGQEEASALDVKADPVVEQPKKDPPPPSSPETKKEQPVEQVSMDAMSMKAENKTEAKPDAKTETKPGPQRGRPLSVRGSARPPKAVDAAKQKTEPPPTTSPVQDKKPNGRSTAVDDPDGVFNVKSEDPMRGHPKDTREPQK